LLSDKPVTIRILLADEHQAVRQGLRTLLLKNPDFEVVEEADHPEKAVSLAGAVGPEVIVLDLTLAGLQDFRLLHHLAAAAPSAKLIVLSLYGDRQFVLEVLKAGAHGFVLKDRAFEELPLAILAVQDHQTYFSPRLSPRILQDYLEWLRHSESRFRTIFAGSTAGIALVDQEGRIVESNPALQELLGSSQEELNHQEFTKFFQPDEAGGSRELFQELVAGKRRLLQVVKQYRRKDGRLAWGRVTVSPSRAPGVDGHFSLGLLEDITEQKQAELKILDYQEKLHSVALELSLTEERERRRWASELHDHAGQILALAQLKLGALRESASTSLAAPLEEISQLLEQTIHYTRSLSFELSPPILDDLGFEAAVEWLGELLQEQYGIRFKVAADRTPKPLDDELRGLLFQLVRELLIKVVKRAKPNNVAVLITRNDSHLGVKIENDGAELDQSADSIWHSSDGFGLFSIRERLYYLGGHLEVGSGADFGTLVTMRVPLKH